MGKKLIGIILVAGLAVAGLVIWPKFKTSSGASNSSSAEQVADNSAAANDDEQPKLPAGTPTQELIKTLTANIAKSPNDLESFYLRALAYEKEHQYGAAILDYNEVLRISPKNANALFNRALMNVKKLNFDAAIADFDAVQSLRPDDAKIFNSRGLVYVEQGSLMSALRDYAQAIKLNPKYGKAYFNRGTLYERQKKLKEAKADYDKAIEFNQADDEDTDAAEANDRLTEAYYRRAIMSLNLGDARSALDDANYVIEHSPKNAKAFKLRAAINSQLGNTAAAASDESTATTLSMENMLK